MNHFLTLIFKKIYTFSLTQGATENMFRSRLFFVCLFIPPEMKNVGGLEEKYIRVGAQVTLPNVS